MKTNGFFYDFTNVDVAWLLYMPNFASTYLIVYLGVEVFLSYIKDWNLHHRLIINQSRWSPPPPLWKCMWVWWNVVVPIIHKSEADRIQGGYGGGRSIAFPYCGLAIAAVERHSPSFIVSGMQQQEQPRARIRRVPCPWAGGARTPDPGAYMRVWGWCPDCKALRSKSGQLRPL